MAQIENIEWLSGFVHGLGEFAVKQGRKRLYGLINASGEIVLEPQPKMLHIRDEKQVMLFRDKRLKGDKDIVLNLETRETYYAERYYAEKYGSAITWQKGRGYGTVDADGNTVIPNKYRSLCSCGSSLFIACNRKNKYGILDYSGNEIYNFCYDEIAFYYNLPLSDRIAVRTGAYWFIADRTGKRLSRHQYELLQPVMPNGYAIFGEIRDGDMYYGLLDAAKYEIVIQANYTDLRWVDDYEGWTRLAARKLGSYIKREEVLTLSGDYVLPQVYGGIWDYYGKNYIVESCTGGIYPDESFYGVIDENGKTVIPFEFCWIYRYGEVYKVCRSDTQLYGLCSLTGETILPCEYNYMDIGDTIDYMAVCKDGEWYYINQLGERGLL